MTKTIERFTQDDKRFYRGLGVTGESVTTLISAFEDKTWLERWRRSLGIKHFEKLGEPLPDDDEAIIAAGKPYADEICTEAATHGTNQHEVAEFILRDKPTTVAELSEIDLPLALKAFLFDAVVPHKHEEYPDQIGCEVPIMFEKGGNAVGGTTDLICELVLDNLYDHDTKKPLGTGKLLCVGDYKFPKKPKYNRDNVKYFVQLATYRAGIKYTYDVDIDNAVLIISPRSTKTLYLWLFDKEVLDYYENTFFELLFLYNNNLTHLFKWEDFVNSSIQNKMVGRRITHKL